MKAKKQPLVSVIMPVYNAGVFLVPAIESILRQTYKHIELIIVDDASTDDSWKTITKYRKRYPKRIRAYHVEKQTNSAGNGATNFGLTKARGSLIARMDSDDVSYPTRIEKQVEYMVANPATILVGTQATVIDKRGKIIGNKVMPTSHEAIYRQFGIVHPMIHPSVMIRRNLLPNPNKIYAMKWDVNDDYYTFFRLLNHGLFANLPEQLLKYRIHGKNLSLTNIKEKSLTTTQIRIDAVKKLNYSMSFLSICMMVVQLLVTTLIPNSILEKIYPVLRGMDQQPRKKLQLQLKRLLRLANLTQFVRKYSLVSKS